MTRPDPLAKLPPQSLDAERSVIGSILLGGHEALDELAEKLQPELRAEEFYSSAHRSIFAAAVELSRVGKKVDAITLADALGDKRLEDVGGGPYLQECMEAVVHAAHVVHHAEIVRTKDQLRQAGEAFVRGLRELDDAHNGEDLAELLGRHETRLHRLIEQDAGNSTVEISIALSELFAAADEPKLAGIPTGWLDLDAVLGGGLAAGRFYILAARPSAGKTALAGNLALNLAQRDRLALIVSLEQSRTELAERLLASTTGIDASRIQKGNLSDAEQQRVLEHSNRLAGLPIAINDASSRTVQQIAAIARLWKRRRGLAVLVIDYLQLVNPEDRRVHREQQVATMSRAIKCLARDLEIPIIALAQLNRAVEARDNKRPKLSDIRESGALEQDADAVLFLHRPFMFDRKADPTEARLIVAKNRHGRIGDVHLRWNADTLTFQSKATTTQQQQFNGF